MTAYELRNLTLEDASDAARLQVETWHETYPGMLPEQILERMTFERMYPLWRNILESTPADSEIVGAFAEGQLLATGMAGKPRLDLGYDAEIWAMNIPRRNQRKGLGRSVFQNLVKTLQEKGAHSVYLTCIDTNENALAFYKSLGGMFAEEKVQRDGYKEFLIFWTKLEA